MEIELVELLHERLCMPLDQAKKFVANLATTELRPEMETLIRALREANIQADDNGRDRE